MEKKEQARLSFREELRKRLSLPLKKGDLKHMVIRKGEVDPSKQDPEFMKVIEEAKAQERIANIARDSEVDILKKIIGMNNEEEDL